MNSQFGTTFTLSPVFDVQTFNAILSSVKQSLGSLGKDIHPIDEVKLNASLNEIKKTFVQATGDATKLANETKKVNDALGGVATKATGLKSTFSGLGAAFNFNMMYQATTQVANSLNKIIEVGDEYNKKLKAVGAFTGTTGAALDALGDKARGLGKAFGDHASNQLEVFSATLSKMGPAYAQNASAMETFGRNVNVLAKAGGMEASQAVDALTNSMLQMGLRTGDASKDAATSTKVINALAASARAGAAQIPQAAESLLQVGGAARGANLSLEETLAGIQVMSVGGKTGAEAGTALRNVLGLMQRTSAEGAAALSKMGLSARELGKTLTTQGLGAAIDYLSKGMAKLPSDLDRAQAKMALFGMENAQAFSIMASNKDRFKEFNDAIVAGEKGTGTAFEMYAQKTGTVSGNIKKMKAYIEDGYISVSKFLGVGVQTALQASTSVAPMLLSFASLKTALPPDLFSKLGAGLSSMATKVGTMATSAIASMTGVAAAETTAGVAGVASGTATTIAWGPIVGILLAIAAAGAGLYLFFTKTESGAKIFESLKNSAMKFWDVMVYGVEKIWSAISPLWESFKWLGGFIWDTLLGAFNEIGKAISDAFGLNNKSSGGGIMDFLKGMFDAFSNILKPIIAVYQFFVGVFAVGFKIWIFAITTYIKGFIFFWKGVFDILWTIGEYVGKAFSWAWDKVTGIFNGIKNAVLGAINWMLKATGLFEPIKSAINSVYMFIKGIIDKISAGVNWVIDQVGKFLGKKDEKKVGVKVEQTTDLNVNLKPATLSKEELIKSFEEQISSIQSQMEAGTLVDKAASKTIKKLKEAIAGETQIDDTTRKSLEKQLDDLLKKSKEKNKAAADNALKIQNDLNKELEKLQDELETKKLELAGKRMQDQTQKELAQIDVKNKKELDKFIEQISTLEKKLNEKKLTSANKEIIQQQIDVLKQTVTTVKEIQSKELEDFYNKVAELEDKRFDDLTKKKSEISKLRLELLKAIQVNLGTSDELSANLKEQASIQQQLLQEDTNDKVNAILRQEKAYKDTAKNVVEAKIQYDKAVLSGNFLSISSAKSELDNAQSIHKQTIANLKQNNEQIKSLINVTTIQEADLKQKTNDQLRELELKNISNFAIRERELKVFEAEKAYKEEYKLALGNLELQHLAFLKFSQAKLDAEQIYMDRASNVWTSGAKNFMSNISDIFSQGLASDDTAKKKAEENISLIQKEEDELKKSLKNREISASDYFKKSTELERKRAAESKAINGDLAASIQTTLFNVFSKTKDDAFNQLANLTQQYKANYSAILQADSGMKKELFSATTAFYTGNISAFDGYMKQYKKFSDEKVATDRKTTNITAELWGQLTLAVGASIGQAVMANEKGWKIIAVTALDALGALVRIYEAELIAKNVAQITDPWTAAIKAVEIAAYMSPIEIALAVAKSYVARLKLGAVDLKGPGTTTSDSIPAMLSRSESVITAEGTLADGNADFFRYANRTGGSIFNYVTSDPAVSKRLAGLFAKEETEMSDKTKAVLIAMQADRENSRQIINELKQQNDKLERRLIDIDNSIKNGNYRRKTTNHVDVAIEVDDKEIIKRAEVTKYRELARR